MIIRNHLFHLVITAVFSNAILVRHYHRITSSSKYTHKIIYVRHLSDIGEEIGNYLKVSVKVLMTSVINDLFEIIGDSDKNYKAYFFKQLKGKEMLSIYNIIGDYQYEDFHK